MQTVMPMPKKKPTTDSRRPRYNPLTAEELREAAKTLGEFAEQLTAAADEVDEMQIEGASIDGRNMLADGIGTVKLVLRRIKTALYDKRLELGG